MEVPRPSPYTSDNHGEYIELMNEYNGRNTSRVGELFVELEDRWVSQIFWADLLQTERYQDDHAYFVFRLAKVDVEDLDIQLLMYHIFKV